MWLFAIVSFRNQNLDIKARPLKLDFQTSGATHLPRMASETHPSVKVLATMLDGTVEELFVHMANLPDKTPTGGIVKSGSLHWKDIKPEHRGCFEVSGEQQEKLKGILPEHGHYGFFVQNEQYDMCMELLDEKGNYKDTGRMAVVPSMTCFCENANDDPEKYSFRFSSLVNSSQQGKQEGLAAADENSGVVTLRIRLLKDPPERYISKGISRGATTRGAMRGSNTCNLEVGYGAFTGTTWKTTNKVAASEDVIVKLRVNAATRDTEHHVLWARNMEEAKKRFGPSDFVPDEMSEAETEEDKMKV